MKPIRVIQRIREKPDSISHLGEEFEPEQLSGNSALDFIKNKKK